MHECFGATIVLENAFNKFAIVYYKTLCTAFAVILKHLFYLETGVIVLFLFFCFFCFFVVFFFFFVFCFCLFVCLFFVVFLFIYFFFFFLCFFLANTCGLRHGKLVRMGLNGVKEV